MIYIKALQEPAERIEDSESRPGLYVALWECQSIPTMLCIHIIPGQLYREHAYRKLFVPQGFAHSLSSVNQNKECNY